MKLNKNKFPLHINQLINTPGIASEEKKHMIKQELKSWYQNSFQKDNRWNRSQLRKQIKDYSANELVKLGVCFELLFNKDNQYHQVFIRYLQEYKYQKDIVKSSLGTPRLKVNQRTFEEIISYLGELKRSGQIKNTNKEIAKIIKLIIEPDKPLEEITIIDRLTKKKGYY